MKNKIRNLGLTGILLGISILPSFAQKKEKDERAYLNGTLNNISYSDKTWENDKFALEMQNIFGYIIDDIPIILAKNENQDQGELPFIIYQENQAKVINVYGVGLGKVGIKYIPTVLTDKKDNGLIKKFHLTEINANLKKIIDKKKIKSQNSYGYSIDITEEMINSKLPVTTLPNGEKYVWLDRSWGFFEADDGEKITNIPKRTLSKFLVPLREGKYIELVNLGNGNISIISLDGFYLPATEEAQTDEDPPIQGQENTKIDENALIQNKEDPNREKDDYEIYHEQKEKEIYGSQPTNTIKQDTIKPEKPDSAIYHIIQKGDTYWNLAERYWGTGKEADEIEKLNPSVDKDNLHPRQRIRIK